MNNGFLLGVFAVAVPIWAAWLRIEYLAWLDRRGKAELTACRRVVEAGHVGRRLPLTGVPGGNN